MRVHGITGLTLAAIEEELEAGGRFVAFEYCISFVLATARRSTDAYFLRSGELGLVRGLPFSLLSVLLGWWGIPWGMIYTPLVLVTNFSGGRDVTSKVIALLRSNSWALQNAERTGGDGDGSRVSTASETRALPPPPVPSEIPT